MNKKTEMQDKSNKCKNYSNLPYIVSIDKKKISRLVVIGDIHGDLDLAINVLLISNLIVEISKKEHDCIKLIYKSKPETKSEHIIKYFKWIATKTIVVQVGDQIDRCRPYNKGCVDKDETYLDESSDLKILFFYYKLHKKALKHGCAVYSLLGNHELLNVLGNMDYVSYLGLKEFNKNKDLTRDKIYEKRYSAFKIDSKKKFHRNSNIATFIGCTRQSALIVGDYLFVHAGIINKFITNIDVQENNRDTLKEINQTIKKWLLNDIDLYDNTFLQQILYDKDLSPFWPRFFGNLKENLPASDKLCVDNVNPVLEYFQIKGIIIGHTPQIGKNINSTCGNNIWRVDFAGSKAFEYVINKTFANIEGRHPQVLEITFHSEGNDTYKIYKLMSDGTVAII